MNHGRSIAIAASLAACACGGVYLGGPPVGSYSYSASTSKAAPSKPGGCDFRLLNLPPQGGFEEIGMVSAPEGERVDTPEAFKSAISDSVCRAGGDVVITQINGGGYYVRGTVLRKTE